jgi:hypothetical protein
MFSLPCYAQENTYRYIVSILDPDKNLVKEDCVLEVMQILGICKRDEYGNPVSETKTIKHNVTNGRIYLELNPSIDMLFSIEKDGFYQDAYLYLKEDIGCLYGAKGNIYLYLFPERKTVDMTFYDYSNICTDLSNSIINFSYSSQSQEEPRNTDDIYIDIREVAKDQNSNVKLHSLYEADLNMNGDGGFIPCEAYERMPGILYFNCYDFMSEAPSEGYVKKINPQPNRLYYFKTADGRYGKMKILSFLLEPGIDNVTANLAFSYYINDNGERDLGNKQSEREFLLEKLGQKGPFPSFSMFMNNQPQYVQELARFSYFSNENDIERSYVELEKKVTINGNPIAKDMIVRKDVSGGADIILAKSMEIDGWLFPKDSIVTTNLSGEVKKTILGSQMSIYDINFPAGSEIEFEFCDSLSVILGGPLEINGLKLSAGDSIHCEEDHHNLSVIALHPLRVGSHLCAANTSISFSDGEIDQYTLGQPTEVKGLVLPAGTNLHYRTYPDEISSITLGDKLEIEGIELQKETLLTLHDSLSLKSIRIPFNTPFSIICKLLKERNNIINIFNTENCPLNTNPYVRINIEFYENGTIYSLALPYNWEINNYSILSGSLVTFYDNGKIKSLTLAAPYDLNNVTLPINTELNFDENGEVIAYYLPDEKGSKYRKKEVKIYSEGQTGKMLLLNDEVVKGLRIPANSMVDTDCDGDIDEIIPSKDILIKGNPIPAQSKITFNYNNNFIRIDMSNDCIYDGVPIAKGSTIGLSKEKFLKYLKVGTDSTIKGIDFKKDSSLCFYKDGNIRMVWLSDVHMISGIKLLKSTKVYFHPSGSIRNIEQHDGYMEIQDLIIAGYSSEEAFGINYLTELWFYSNGKIRRAPLSKPQKVDGVLCEALYPVYLYPDGKLRSCMLAEDQEINRTKYPKMAYLDFDKDGNVVKDGYGPYKLENKKIKLSKPTYVNGINCPKGSLITYNKTDEIEKIILSKPIKFDTVKIPANSEISFGYGGYVFDIRLGEDIMLNGDSLIAGNRIYCDRHGNLIEKTSYERYEAGYEDKYKVEYHFIDSNRPRRAETIYQMKINNIDIPDRTNIVFDYKGKIINVILNDDCMINNVNYPQSSLIAFDDDGKIRKVLLGGDAEFNRKIVLPQGSSIMFDSQGNITKVRLGDMALIYETVYYPCAILYFDSKMNIIKVE